MEGRPKVVTLLLPKLVPEISVTSDDPRISLEKFPCLFCAGVPCPVQQDACPFSSLTLGSASRTDAIPHAASTRQEDILLILEERLGPRPVRNGAVA